MTEKPIYEELEKKIQELEQERTKSKQVEEELRESQQVIEGILNTIPVRVFWKDQNLVFLGCNGLFAMDAGFVDPKDIIGKDDYQMGWRDQAKLYQKDDKEVIDSGNSKFLIEEPQTTPEGDTITLLTSKTPLHNATGDIIGMLGAYMDITDRKKIESDLRANEERYRSIFSQSPIAIEFYDGKGALIDVNSACLDLFGVISIQAIQGFNLFADPNLPDEQKERLKNGATIRYQAAFDFEKVKRLNLYHTRRDGIIQIDVLIAPIGDPVRGYLVQVQDITERKKAEEALQNSEKLFRDTFECSTIGKALTALDGNLFKVNPAFADMLGYTKEEMQKLDFATLTHPDDINMSWKGFRSVLSGERNVFRCKKRYIHKNKNIIWADVNVNLLRNEQGKPLYCIAGIIDITKSVMAEEAMRESEKKLNMIFSAMTEMFVLHELVLDEQGDAVNYRILDCNHAFTEVTGIQKEKVIGKLATEVYETKIPPYLDAYSKVAIAGLPAKFTAYFPPMNKYFIISVVSPKKNHFLTVTTDITENKRDELVREKLQAQLTQAQKMESIGTLAGGIAHDFNNILFPIVGRTEMLLEDIPEDSPFRNSLNEIFTSALRASELVKQILTFSRQENNELKLMKMQPIIKEALKLIRSTIPTTIEIKQYIKADCGVIKADPTQIHQIVMNLATNAYHAMEETGGELKVTLKQIELGEYDVITPDMIPGAYACLNISDTGIGMDKELIEKIFDPFFTTKKQGKGTGMGLSVVHGIVISMGGTIHVYSEPGKGTQFNVYFPIEKSLSETQVIHSTVSIQGGIEHILFVDDEETIITMEKQMLERLGYQVTSRTSSLEALEAFRENPDKFDMVITDMAMPNMSGIKLSAELTKIRPDIPILLCTGFSETMSEEKAAFLGIKGFLMKPIIMKDLAQKIREVLDKN